MCGVEVKGRTGIGGFWSGILWLSLCLSKGVWCWIAGMEVEIERRGILGRRVVFRREAESLNARGDISVV